MSDLKNFLLQIRYPYTAGVIAIIWFGGAVLLALQPSLSVTEIVLCNAVASCIIALIGFARPKRS